jgi:hypothetical protein
LEFTVMGTSCRRWKNAKRARFSLSGFQIVSLKRNANLPVCS